MRTVAWMILACGGMRYNACAAVTLGSDCSEEHMEQLECTKKPKSTVDDNCNEFLVEDHIIAQCILNNGQYTWQPYARCTDGMMAMTNGYDFECNYNQVYDCNDDNSDNSDWDEDWSLDQGVNTYTS